MIHNSSFKGIFKSTFLFSFVRVFQIIIGIIKNKIIAVLLGAEGVGIINILSNSVAMIQSGTSLGISQSAVRDISESSAAGDNKKFSKIISLTNIVILITCMLGVIVTLGLSPLMSQWTFGDNSYTVAYLWLSLVVGLNIVTEGQLAILKGMRKLRSLAKASVIGSLVGLITAVPMYYFYGKGGIVPSLIITGFSAVFFSNYFVRKINYEKVKLTYKELYLEATPMLKMGVALMLVGFLGLLFELIIAAYIRSHGGLEIVGYYTAGTTIITSYFGIVLTAMTTDYYPRISAVHFNNIKLQEEMNQQSKVGLLLIYPIAVLFVFLSPLFIQILYSKEFSQTILYTDFAILGIIIIICSNNMGMILLAKQASKTFTIYSLSHRLFFLPIYIYTYSLFGLKGLGITYLINAVIQLVSYELINRFKYNIKLDISIIWQLVIVLVSILISLFVRTFDNVIIRYFLGFILFLISSIYTLQSIKQDLGIDLWEYLKSKIKK